jgi:tRNA 2-selenouridine synthase SelU
MTNDEAKVILGAYRPNGQDAADALFCEATRQAQQDPQLAAWFARAQGLDALMRGKLRELAPPPGLKEAILALGRPAN